MGHRVSCTDGLSLGFRLGRANARRSRAQWRSRRGGEKALVECGWREEGCDCVLDNTIVSHSGDFLGTDIRIFERKVTEALGMCEEMNAERGTKNERKKERLWRRKWPTLEDCFYCEAETGAQCDVTADTWTSVRNDPVEVGGINGACVMASASVGARGTDHVTSLGPCRQSHPPRCWQSAPGATPAHRGVSLIQPGGRDAAIVPFGINDPTDIAG
ncbi:hypothetical protein SKAU_G00296940 [Synaphobranchus kaupii]|uniref:Uncharacterized protein n=1 Tax=Synaphobranchus kaupii TaxID=118154 RepID=A0A9Q1EUW6_SYNKA|nr:hypothetical protein SKAU_G00296940 [Synaphobranchus kaupii]